MIRVRRTLPETRLSNPTTQLPVIQPVPVTFKMSTIASGADGQGVEGGAGGVESMGMQLAYLPVLAMVPFGTDAVGFFGLIFTSSGTP